MHHFLRIVFLLVERQLFVAPQLLLILLLSIFLFSVLGSDRSLYEMLMPQIICLVYTILWFSFVLVIFVYINCCRLWLQEVTLKDLFMLCFEFYKFVSSTESSATDNWTKFYGTTTYKYKNVNFQVILLFARNLNFQTPDGRLQ